MHVPRWKFVPASLFMPLLFVLLQSSATAQTFSNGYSYRNAITIDHTKVPNTDQSNFAVLFSGTYAFLATTSNGGNVTNSNGYDIIFTSDPAGTSVLPFEQASYSPVTGQVTYWVEIPTLSHTNDTVFYVFYGNSSITTDQSNKTGTWDSNYLGVWHLATKLVFDASDSTSNADNGTVQGTVSATPGEIGGAATFDGLTGYISTATNMTGLNSLTSEAWIQTTSTAGHKISGLESNQTGTTSGSYPFQLYVDTNGKAVGACAQSGFHTVVSSSAVNDGGWHHLVMALSSGSNSFVLYVDGVSQGTATCAPGNWTAYFRIASYKLSGWANGSDGYFAGSVDEVKLSKTVRSSDWVTTEYNNQSSPSTFYSVSAAQTGFATPNISSLSPSSGAVGDSITIAGTGFGSSQGSSTVAFNGSLATITSWSSTSISATVPLGASTGSVIVTVGGLTSNAVTFTVSSAPSWSNGYSYRRPITISHTRVPHTDQLNFPFLVSGTYADLAATANGGYVTNSNGYDIVFASDAAGTNLLPFERESYSASTGQVLYWVQVPSISHRTDTTIYLFYGNSSITTDQSNKTGTWDSNYKGVWHLPNGTTLTANDSTSDSYNGTVSGATAVTGMIDGGAGLSGSSQYITMGNALNMGTGPMTLEAWVKAPNTNALGTIVGKRNNSSPWQQYDLVIGYTNSSGNGVAGKMIGFFASGGGNSSTWESFYTSSNIVDGNWHHVAVTRNSSGSVAIYADGASQPLYTVSSPGSIPNGDNTSNFNVGYDNGSGYLDASVDEVKVSNSARSADWIATEYNNQSSPSTFYSVGLSQTGIPTPQVTSLSPTSGAVSAAVTISGTNFASTQGTSTVTFNGVSAAVTSWSSTSISTSVPAGAVTGNVVVTVGGVPSNGVSFTVSSAPAWSNNYGYRQPIAIDHTKVPNTDQANFPLLFSGTYPALATTSNGGFVTNSSGYDIVFASDGSGLNLLPFEQESYNPSTGAVSYWVQVPTVSHTTDTTIYMFYGNSSITTDQSNKTGTWDSNYKGVWHFDQTPSGSGSIKDSTSDGYNGTPASSGISLSSDGIAGGSLHFNGTSAANNVTMSSSLPGGPPITVSIWVKTTGLNSSAQSIIIDKSVWSSHGWSSLDDGQYNSVIWFRTMPNPTTAPSIPRSLVNNGTWHYLVGTVNSSNLISFYLDGSLYATATPSSITADTAESVSVGGFQGNSAGGSLTEVRISSIARSADWITTEYNNETSPSTFYSLGTAETGLPNPQITSLTPTSGAVGASVTISGTNFGSSQGSSTVAFNGVVASVTGWSSTSLTALVPLKATTGNVVVTVMTADSAGSSFTVSPTPTITSLSRRSGAVGAAVTISGSGFGATQGSGAVSFGGTTASVSSWSATGIVTSVPSGATTGDVVVFTSGVNSAGASFSVPPSASVTSLSKTSGFPGNVVTITGTNFGVSQTAVGGSVAFNSTTATVTGWSSTSIVAVVPLGATSGNLVVTANGGPSNGVGFAIDLPTITSLSPTSGAVGTSVSVAGANFGATQGTSSVAFNGTTATVSSWSATSIGVTVPTGASTGQVVVTVSGVASQGMVFSVGTTLSGTVTQSGGTGISGASVQVFQNGSSKASSTTGSGGTYSISSLQTGTYDVSFSASGFGTALQTGVSVTSSGTTLNQMLGSAGTIAGQITQSNGTTAISGASIAVTQSGEPVATATSDSSGNYSIGTLSAGSYSLSASASGYVTLGLNGVSVTSGNTTTENLSLNAVGTLPITYFYDSLGRLVGVVDTAGEAAGYSYDAVGNVLAITRATSAQTSVISFSPSQGVVGTTVTIYGTGFSTTTSSDSVTFNGTTATVTAATTTALTVTVPTGATTGTISVTSPNGTGTSPTNFTVTTNAGLPTISSFSPTVGKAGTSITVTGTNYDSSPANDRLRFNYETATTAISSASSTSLSSTVPAGVTSGHISVATAAGSVTSSGDFFVPPGSYTASNVVQTGRVSLNGNVTMTISASGTIGLFVFDAAAGQQISVSFTAQTVNSFGAAIYSPSGSVLFNYGNLGGGGNPLPYIDRMTLSSTGTYTIMLYASGTNTGSVTINLNGITDVTGTITPTTSGTTVNATNTVPGQNCYYTFSGTAGQMVFLTLSGSYSGRSSNPGAYVTLYNPDGSVNHTNWVNLGSGTIIFTASRITLPSTGTYTFLVDPYLDSVGTTTLTFYNVVDWTGSITPNGSNVTVPITTPGQYGFLTFSGTAGQLVTVSTHPNNAGSITMGLEEGSTVLASASASTLYFGPGQQTLPNTDTYTIFIEPGSGGTGNVTIQLTSP